MELSRVEFLLPVGAGRLEGSVIPNHDRAAAVLALGDCAFEMDVRDGVVFNLHRQPLFAFEEGNSFGHGPGFQRAADFEPEVIMQPGGGMLLNYETMARAL